MQNLVSSERFKVGVGLFWVVLGSIELVHLSLLDVDEDYVIWVLDELELNVDELEMKYRYGIAVFMGNQFFGCVQPGECVCLGVYIALFVFEFKVNFGKV